MHKKIHRAETTLTGSMSNLESRTLAFGESEFRAVLAGSALLLSTEIGMLCFGVGLLVARA